MNNLKISTATQGDAVIITLSGAADMAEIAQLRQTMDKLLEDSKSKWVLDLSELSFISSIGLGTLIHAQRHCQENAGFLALVNPQEEVVSVLKTTQLDQIFDIYPDITSALEKRKSN